MIYLQAKAVKEPSEDVKDCRIVSLVDGSVYDLDHLANDPLLNNLNEWDYPIFDLLDQYGQHILSTVSIQLVGHAGGAP